MFNLSNPTPENLNALFDKRDNAYNFAFKHIVDIAQSRKNANPEQPVLTTDIENVAIIRLQLQKDVPDCLDGGIVFRAMFDACATVNQIQ
jgi:hypothetical protein